LIDFIFGKRHINLRIFENKQILREIIIFEHNQIKEKKRRELLLEVKIIFFNGTRIAVIVHQSSSSSKHARE